MALSTEAEIEASYRDGAAQYVADRFRAGLHRLLHERRVAAVQRVIDQIFDLVYTFRFVRHFRRSDRERLYVQVRRVLKPGGYFVLDAVNERISRPLRQVHPEDYPIYDELFRRDDLCRELAGAGLDGRRAPVCSPRPGHSTQPGPEPTRGNAQRLSRRRLLHHDRPEVTRR